MNVHRIPTGTSSIDGRSTGRTAATPHDASAQPEGGSATAGGDRLELSAEARARLAEEARRDAEVEQARRSLHALPEQALSPEQVARFAERVEGGFYDQPSVTEAVARRLAGGRGDG